ncbi:hypothetical protein [Actinoallomurus soli]|uniref:hypothetical protein n=1 Tax=Actinoallomurus soli TaxID=2952535 RepID=UPI002093AB0A|nr:hypothetical protein [Actinoallomurus soli]MCO5967916.1 hypothetical protein [Actinoallomurus soli]
MDQGLGVLLGAGVGALGTAVTATLTAWWARGQAKLTADAQREQAQAQARVDHARWRRETRRDAYAAFLDTVHAVHDRAERARSAVMNDPGRLIEGASTFMQEAQALREPLRARWAVVAMEGPKPVGTAAKTLLDRTSDWLVHVEVLIAVHGQGKSQEPFEEACASAYHDVHAALVKFIATAEAVLDASPVAAPS